MVFCFLLINAYALITTCNLIHTLSHFAGPYKPVTVTLNLQAASFPSPSLNRYVTSVDPAANSSPGAWLCRDTVGSLTELSMANGSCQVTCVEDRFVNIVMLLGQAMTIGGVVSLSDITV